jgi:hypothetical protein
LIQSGVDVFWNRRFYCWRRCSTPSVKRPGPFYLYTLCWVSKSFWSIGTYLYLSDISSVLDDSVGHVAWQQACDVSIQSHIKRGKLNHTPLELQSPCLADRIPEASGTTLYFFDRDSVLFEMKDLVRSFFSN